MTKPTPGRFSEREQWGLYWVAWWMDEHQRNGKLGGTLTEAIKIVREMIGPLPEGYSYDPDDEAPDDELIESMYRLAIFADDRDVDGHHTEDVKRVFAFVEGLI